MTLSLILLIVFSCDEPETTVTDVVHTDGSVTRKIEMRNSKNKFEQPDFQVPFDSTWTISKSFEISSKGDTTWIEKAEKQFPGTEEINKLYRNDPGVNGRLSRQASFSKKFRWFNTEYRFSEIIGNQIPTGYPLSTFLNSEELAYFYSPDYLKFDKEHGADSLKYKRISDSIEIKSMRWLVRNFVSLWIDAFCSLTGPDAGPGLSRSSLKSRENEFAVLLEANQEKFDSLWSKGILPGKLIGEGEAIKYKTEADSAESLATDRLFPNFKDYTVRIAMPGKLTATNGFMDSTRNILWPVGFDYYLTDRYEMWAESKTPNRWAWVVSGLFLLFVAAGIFIKRKNPAGGGIQTKT